MNDSQTLQQQAIEIMEIIEEVVENYCDDNMVSGEKVWVMIRALSDCNLKQFPHIDEEELGVDYVVDNDTLEEENEMLFDDNEDISDAW